MKTRDTTPTDDIPIVFVVDDDPSIRESLESTICRCGWTPRAFASAQEFLAYPRALAPSCLILSVTLPNQDALDLKSLIAGRTAQPVIVITEENDVPMTVRAMKAGAFEFMTKPLEEEAMVSAIIAAIDLSRDRMRREAELQALSRCYATLSRREREVMALVVDGRLNKLIGAGLGISEITVKAHRGRVMRKMGAKSLAHLVRIAAELGLVRAWSGHPRTGGFTVSGTHAAVF